MKLPSVIAFLLAFVFAASSPFLTTLAQDDKAEPKKGLPSIEVRLGGAMLQNGFFQFWFEESTGKVLLLARFDEEFLYVHSLATGLGSNPVGLDRGQLGGEKVVRFERIGNKALLVQRNLRYRAITDQASEQAAVRQSFAQSVIWGGTLESAPDENGNALIDISGLLMKDIHGVTTTLSRSEQGEFSLDKDRSAIYLPRCKGFPKNTEFEATLTFASSKPGRLVRQTTPTPEAVSLRQHHSFIELPDNNYRPREYDVRSPCIHITFADYATGLDQPLEKRWITRHRLEKKDPSAELSEPVEPIIYYVDSGAPKLIRDALIEGASWWNDAFESAGFKNAFQVQVLPPDADPMDVRYNVIQWVHRSTRGWSYGGSVIDPRTGEIIKGHVSLGSLRVRQDRLLAIGITEATPSQNLQNRCACCGLGSLPGEFTLAALSRKQSPVDVALARIRQLSAHEVGHTLGFVHNFAASTYDDRASVMDYPAPRVTIADDRTLDLSDAYGVGIGSWDKVAVQFAYQPFSAAEEAKSLNTILNHAAQRGMLFISDSDARPAGAAHPMGNLWDNGTDPISEFRHVMQVRRIALNQFNISDLPPGTNSADVEQYLVPIYLHHRYQLNAIGKVIGGYDYAYGDASNVAIREVPFADQLLATRLILNAISPQNLALPKDLIDAIGVKPYSSVRDQETFPRKTGRTFDSVATARVAADLAVHELLQPQRMARFAKQAETLPNMDLQRYVDVIIGLTWAYKKNAANKSEKTLTRVARRSVVDRMISLVDSPSASEEIKDALLMGLFMVQNLCEEDLKTEAESTEIAFLNSTKRRVSGILTRSSEIMPVAQPVSPPPGSPIGN